MLNTIQTLPRLQYISDGNTYEEQLHSILAALEAGIKWIQLRWKNASSEEIETLSQNIQPYCDKYKAILIINDYPEIARKVGATGVHLGLKDMPVEEARKILYPHQWIGGTANTLNDVMQRINENVNYIGLGPLRYTFTKKELSPILGYEGYKDIIAHLPSSAPPIFAIGGINEKDIEPLMKMGVYGIALSSAINKAQNKYEYVQQLNQLLYGTP